MNDMVKSMRKSVGIKDWPEDLRLFKNNCCQHECYVCKEPFFGGKRKVICKECALK